MLRCLKLYSAIHEVRNILHSIIEMGGIVEKALAVAYKYPLNHFADEDDQVPILECLKMMEKLSKTISRFLHEHKLFTTFVFRSKEYQTTLRENAKSLNSKLKNEDKLEYFKWATVIKSHLKEQK